VGRQEGLEALDGLEVLDGLELARWEDRSRQECRIRKGGHVGRRKEAEAKTRIMTVGAILYSQLLTCPSPSRVNPVRLSTHISDYSAEASLVSLP
jgi:hypothetical protein